MIKLVTYAAFIVALMASGAAPASAQVPGDQPIVGISLESSTPIVATVAGADPSATSTSLQPTQPPRQSRWSIRTVAKFTHSA